MSELKFPINLDESMLAKAIAELVAEKQKRIDRLEQLIFSVYQNVCIGKEALIIADDDRETDFCSAIIEQYNKIKDNEQQD